MTSLDREALARSFVGNVEPVPVRPSYKLGLVVVAIVTLLLPLVYLGVVAAVAYGVYWHAVNNASIIIERQSLSRVIAYVGPIVAGVVLFFFLWKPVLARSRRESDDVILSPAEAPLLFDFVERIRVQLDAPAPSEIRVDAEVNASASFRRGLASVFGRGDLVLTIGMPLVAGLTIRQLAGVLAHELGHFAQGSSMRLTYLIRSINLWLIRVATERDHWDDKLNEAQEKAPGRIKLIFLLANLSVWLTRQLLAGLALAGHAIGTFMMREMELDADRYEARLAGSDVFESTVKQLRVLSNTRLMASVISTDTRRGGLGLCDDLAGLTAALAERLEPAPREMIESQRAGTSRRAFDTHPPDSERIANARAENATGVFRLEAPARALFGEGSPISKRVSLAHYRRNGDPVAEEQLLGLQAVLALRDAAGARGAAAGRVFNRAIDLLHPLIDDTSLERSDETDADDAPRRQAAERLRSASVKLASSTVRALLPDPVAMERELARHRALLDALALQRDAIVELKNAREGLQECMRRRAEDRASTQLEAQLTLAQARLHRTSNDIEQRLSAIPDPTEPSVTLADRLAVGLAVADPSLAAMHRAESLVTSLGRLQRLALGRLAEIVEQVEAAARDTPEPSAPALAASEDGPARAER